jgi:hypothetical protein
LPPAADLIVDGRKIFALTKGKDGKYIKDIEIPGAK